jgi:glutamine synthetase
MKDFTEMNPNPLVQYLNKPAEEFTRLDIIKYVEDNNIEMINFRYVGWDGRLKTLNFIISSRQHLETILTMGERVDGSSLFSFIEAVSSDLYVIPKYRTAFLNPFTEIPTLDIICSYFNKDGEPLESSPEYILKKADKALKEKTGYELQAMGELEYYIISPKENLYMAEDQRGYHESTPFTKWEHLRTEAMQAIAQAGGQIKYGHSKWVISRLATLCMSRTRSSSCPVRWKVPPSSYLLPSGSCGRWLTNTGSGCRLRPRSL